MHAGPAPPGASSTHHLLGGAKHFLKVLKMQVPAPPEPGSSPQTDPRPAEGFLPTRWSRFLGRPRLGFLQPGLVPDLSEPMKECGAGPPVPGTRPTEEALDVPLRSSRRAERIEHLDAPLEDLRGSTSRRFKPKTETPCGEAGRRSWTLEGPFGLLDPSQTPFQLRSPVPKL